MGLIEYIENKWLKDSMPIRLKLFNIIMAGVIFSGIFSLIVSIIYCAQICSILMILAAILLMIMFVYYTNKYNLVQIGSTIICIIGSIIFAAVYFLGGGIESGMSHWFVIGIVFSFLVLESKLFWTTLIWQLLLYSICFIISYYNPQYVKKFDTVYSQYVDIAQCAFIVSVTIGAIIKYQGRLYKKEKNVNDKQKILLKEAVDEAKTANDEKSRFLANMSHEIRTPMNAIYGIAQILESEKQLGEKEKEYIKLIKNSANNLLDIINDLLDFSKIESGKFEIVPEAYDFNNMLNEIVDIIKIQLKNKNVELILNIDSQIPKRLYGDYGKVRQVLLNILNNAVKFTYEGSIQLSIRWERLGIKDGKLIIQVTDSGVGIKNQDIPELFEAFSQVDMKRNRNIEGTGLGLAICKELIHMMEGSITVSSVYGKGSTFNFFIRQDIIDGTPSEFGKLKGKLSGESQYNIDFEAPQAKVLVVDDNHVNQKVAQGLLEKFHIETICVSSGEKAIELIKEGNYYDIIFMDHMMPNLDGVETTQIIRQYEAQPANARLKRMIIVALTANAINGMKQMFLEADMNDFVAKPIKMSQLAYVLRTWLPNDKIIDITPQIYRNNYEKLLLNAMTELRRINIDVEEGMSYYLNDYEMYLDVLDAFTEYDLTDKLLYTYNQNDFYNYSIYVHSIKSSSRGIGAIKLSDSACAIESALVSGDNNYIRRHHSDFIADYVSVMDTLKHVLKTIKGESDDNVYEREQLELQKAVDEIAASDQEIDSNKLFIDSLKNMRALLEKCEVNSIEEKLSSIIISFNSEDNKEFIAKLENLVYSFEYERAIEAIDYFLM